MKEIKMNSNCIFCGNKNLTAKRVQYLYKYKEDFFIVNNVPCIVCDYCGEQYFEGETLENIEKLFMEIHNNKRSAAKKILVPMEDYTYISE